MEKLSSDSHLKFLEFCEEYVTYLEEHSDLPTERLIPFLKSILTNPYYYFYVIRDMKQNINAFILYRIDDVFPDEGTIMFIYISPNSYSSQEKIRKEHELFSYAFSSLKIQAKLIGVITDGYSSELKQFVLENGFKIMERYSMEISTDEISKLPLRQFSENLEIIPWNSCFVEKIIPIVHEYNIGSVDKKIYSFFHNFNTTGSFLKELQNHRWGIFLEKSSRVLVSHDNSHDKFHGTCFFVLKDDITAQIPEIGLISEYQGKGIGKTMLNKSLKNLIEINPKIQKVQLDVSLENQAYHMYKSVGFKKIREHSIMYWHDSKTRV